MYALIYKFAISKAKLTESLEITKQAERIYEHRRLIQLLYIPPLIRGIGRGLKEVCLISLYKSRSDYKRKIKVIDKIPQLQELYKRFKRLVFNKKIDFFEFETSENLELRDEHHSIWHSSNAFCGFAGPEEREHLRVLVGKLKDNELISLIRDVGIEFALDLQSLEREDYENVVDEADREDFYRSYRKILEKRRKNI